MMQGKLMSKFQERAGVTTLALYSFDAVIIVHLCTSVYINVTQYSL
jgi:hypothetical protein